MQDTETRTDLQRLIDWLKTYTGITSWAISRWTTPTRSPPTALCSRSLQEVERTETILGDVTLTNQYNFGLYFTFEKSAEDDVAARSTPIADGLSALGAGAECPQARTEFRQHPDVGAGQCQNGQLFSVDGCGTAIYMVTLSVTFEQFYPDEFK